MKVERVFTRNVVGTTRGFTLQQAAAAMRKFHVGTLVVMGDAPLQDEAIGIVTDRDMVLQAMAEGLSPRDVTVGEVMSPMVAKIGEDAELHEALSQMRAGGVRRLLVTQRNGAIAGILSVDDVVDGLATELAMLARVAKSEIDLEADEYGGVRVCG